MGASYDGLTTRADRIADLIDLAAKTAADGALKTTGSSVAESFRIAIARLRVVADDMRVLAQSAQMGVIV